MANARISDALLAQLIGELGDTRPTLSNVSIHAALRELQERRKSEASIPRYKHDCASHSCRFLGRFEEWDLYGHKLTPAGVTLIGRYGNIGNEYHSLRLGVIQTKGDIPWFDRAVELAQADGLIAGAEG